MRIIIKIYAENRDELEKLKEIDKEIIKFQNKINKKYKINWENTK